MRQAAPSFVPPAELDDAAPDGVVRPVTGGASHFFGFHDLSPWDESGRQLVCLRSGVDENRVPDADDIAELCVVDEASGDTRILGTTRAWNWQQASRQRWLPGPGTPRVIYNVATERGFGARIVDVESEQGETIDWPVFDVAPGGDFALSVDFSRLGRLYRSYGYQHRRSLAPRRASEDGIFRVDLKSGQHELLLSIAEVAGSFEPRAAENEHFFTHVSVSPDARRYCFLHRRPTPSGGVATDLVVADMHTGLWSVLARDRVSHFDWWGAEHIVAWTRKNAAIRKIKEGGLGIITRPLFRLSRRMRGRWLRRSLYRESFRTYDVVDGGCRPFGVERIPEDGHPQVNPRLDHIWVIDTYADQSGLQTLSLYDASRDERLDVARLPTPDHISGTGWRCDLHPRWDPSGRRICVDSAHLGKRQLCVIDVSREVEARAGAA